MSQTIGEKRVSKFISSSRKQFQMSWHGVVGLSLTSRVCPATDSANMTLHTTHCAWRNTQWADHAVTRACPVQPGSVTACNRCPRIVENRGFALSLSSIITMVPYHEWRNEIPKCLISCERWIILTGTLLPAHSRIRSPKNLSFVDFCPLNTDFQNLLSHYVSQKSKLSFRNIFINRLFIPAIQNFLILDTRRETHDNLY